MNEESFKLHYVASYLAASEVAARAEWRADVSRDLAFYYDYRPGRPPVEDAMDCADRAWFFYRTEREHHEYMARPEAERKGAGQP